METLYFLIPLGIVFVIIAIKILFWAINSGQYDNLDTEAHRILFDDDSNDAKVGKPADNAVKKDSAARVAGDTADTSPSKESDQ